VVRDVAPRAQAREVDNRAATAVFHQLRRLFGREPGTEDVELEAVAQVLRQLLQGITGPFETTSGAVDEDVEAAALLLHADEQFVNRLDVAKVGPDRYSSGAQLSELMHDTLGLFGAPVVVDDN